MTTTVDLPDEQLQILKALTKQTDASDALRTAVAEYIRYATRLRQTEHSEQVAVAGNGPSASPDSVAEDSQRGRDEEPEREVDSDLDRWYAELDAGCAQLDEEDDRSLRQAILEVHAEEMELARKQAALEE